MDVQGCHMKLNRTQWRANDNVHCSFFGAYLV